VYGRVRKKTGVWKKYSLEAEFVQISGSPAKKIGETFLGSRRLLGWIRLRLKPESNGCHISVGVQL